MLGLAGQRQLEVPGGTFMEFCMHPLVDLVGHAQLGLRVDLGAVQPFTKGTLVITTDNARFEIAGRGRDRGLQLHFPCAMGADTSGDFLDVKGCAHFNTTRLLLRSRSANGGNRADVENIIAVG